MWAQDTGPYAAARPDNARQDALSVNLLQLDLAQALVEEALCGDRLRVPARVFGAGARGQHVDQEVRIRVQEERHRITRLARRLARGIDHAVDGGRIHVVGQALEHVADVDHDRVAL